MSSSIPPLAGGDLSPVSALPAEVLVHVFDFLPPSDVLQCSLACRAWAAASAHAHRGLHRRVRVVLHGDEQLAEAVGVFSSSHGDGRPTFSRFDVSDASLSPPSPGWLSLLPGLTGLTLRRCSVGEKDLAAMLARCPRLRRLALVDMREVFISGNFLSSPEEAARARAALGNLVELDLSSNQYMSDTLFDNVISCAENLESLVLDRCRIVTTGSAGASYNPALYPNTVFTFRCLLRFLGRRAGKLKRLSLYGTSVDGVAVQDMARVEGLALEEVNLGRCSAVSQESVLDLARANAGSLRALNLDYCRRVLMDYPATSLSIFQEMAEVRRLSLRGNTVPVILGSCLAQLDRLEELDCSELDSLGRYLCEGLGAAGGGGGKTLRRLYMRSFGCSPDVVIRLCSALTNLTVLDLSNCQEGVTNAALQAVIGSMRGLEELRLNNCRRLTDVGFSGLSTELGEREEERLRIFLGSKAEAEIVSGAQQSKILAELEREADVRADAKLRIDSLPRLRSLDVGSVARLTNLSLLTSFRFADLRSVDLSGCRSLTDAGFSALARCNPRLESVRAKQCELLGDLGLAALLWGARRLRELDLEGCRGVTSEGVMAMISAGCCRELRSLDVSFCPRVGTAAVEALRARMPRLRRIACRGLHISECLEEDYGESIGGGATKGPKAPRSGR